MVMETIAKGVRLSGRTTRFSGNGRELGYPTANIQTTARLKDGVYLGRAKLAEFDRHPALIFVGVPTTVGDTVWRVEAHLLDIADRDYYDLPLVIELIRYVRANKTFATKEALKRQMKADEADARRYFSQELHV